MADGFTQEPVADLTPAPLRLRAAAGCVNVAAVGCLIVPVSAWAWLRGRRRGRRLDSTSADASKSAFELGMDGAFLGQSGLPEHVRAVINRNRRSVGQQVIGLRRVDARTGGPVTLLGAARLQAMYVIQRWLISRLVIPRMRAVAERSRVARAEVEAELGDAQQDPVAFYRAVSERTRGQPGCGPPLAIMLANLVLQLVPLPFSRYRQRWPERVAGTVLVRDEGVTGTEPPGRRRKRR